MTEKKCIAQLGFEAYTKGEISLEDMQKMVALDAAETLYDHVMRLYPPAKTEHKRYIQQRINNLISKDEYLAKENGKWLYLTRQILTENNKDIGFLNWAHEICGSLGATEKVFKIKNHLIKFLENDFPKDFYEECLRVQRMDSEDS